MRLFFRLLDCYYEERKRHLFDLFRIFKSVSSVTLFRILFCNLYLIKSVVNKACPFFLS